MADMRDLWWAAGRMAFSVAGSDTGRTNRWADSLRRSAALLEPVWPKGYSAGPFTHALPTIALYLYAVRLGDDPEHVSADEIVTALTPRRAAPEAPSLEDTVRENLTKRGHDLDDDSELSTLVRYLGEYRPPLATGIELASDGYWSGGTLMGAAAAWVHGVFTHHYLQRDSA
ncbi:hypothetical protein [Streptomyces boluensis]|uniref:Uncharacterized protein n=1 Tax=Streptomyces boluensis TaxID=1775135 RepID=A0A964XLQ9_9ACTN|nr:hypothetical protein [Streptomyces boluensis]NBE51997.1 hypothetical protein [Streptomyces boluensis]